MDKMNKYEIINSLIDFPDDAEIWVNTQRGLEKIKSLGPVSPQDNDVVLELD